jgi:hypothetical protein
VDNVASLYGEFSGGTAATPPIGEMFSMMRNCAALAATNHRRRSSSVTRA